MSNNIIKLLIDIFLMVKKRKSKMVKQEPQMEKHLSDFCRYWAIKDDRQMAKKISQNAHFRHFAIFGDSVRYNIS